MKQTTYTYLQSVFVLLATMVISNVQAKDELTNVAQSTPNQWEIAGYNESTEPIKDHSAYRPLKRVLVNYADTEILDAMARIMPNVDFISSRQASDEPNNFDAILARCGSADLIKKAPNAAWVHSYSAGVDSCLQLTEIQNLLARDDGLILTNSSGTSAAVIAEHAIGMMMTMTRGLHRYRDFQSETNWNRNAVREPNLMQTITGKTILVLGLGSIGQEVAKRANALGMRVTATRNSSRSGPSYVDYVGLSNETIELVKNADVIVNALPLTESTKGFIDNRFFAAMQPSAYYISVGRGGTTDTQALMDVLENNDIAGAALDVTDPEPLPKSHPLWQLDNVIITPHISWSGGETNDNVVKLVLENLRRYQAGEPLLNIVNTNLGY